MAAPGERRVGRGVQVKRHKSTWTAGNITTRKIVGHDFTKLCEQNKLHLGFIRIMHALGLIRHDAFF
jgi:hypothetical protein